MQVTGGGRPRGVVQSRGRIRHDRFERLRPACDDLPVDKLPTDALLDEIGVDLVGEAGGVILAPLAIVLGKVLGLKVLGP